ncbi:MAG TPA: hypothetical protein VH394_03675 [Thermoanaerobaculia bacterium]|nr:hypothetical protein [Thermoanaerobaculia bacterium]
MSIETLDGMGTVHVINVTFIGGSIQVTPDPLKIHSGESVRWDFIGIPDAWGRMIRFSGPAGVEPDRGPFTGSLLSGSYPKAGKKVNTITGPNADSKICKYEYDVVLTTPNGTRIELDPVIDNQGPPE